MLGFYWSHHFLVTSILDSAFSRHRSNQETPRIPSVRYSTTGFQLKENDFSLLGGHKLQRSFSPVMDAVDTYVFKTHLSHR